MTASAVPPRKKKSKRLRRIGAFLAGVVSALSAVGIVNALIPAQIPSAEAKTFLADHYFVRAPQEPAATLVELTTANYQAIQEANGGYEDFWRKVDRVHDVNVTPIADQKNVFRTSWVVVYDTRKREKVTRVGLELKCTGWRYWMPAFVKCRAEDLKLNQSYGAE